jgi:hypothetical protein
MKQFSLLHGHHLYLEVAGCMCFQNVERTHPPDCAESPQYKNIRHSKSAVLTAVTMKYLPPDTICSLVDRYQLFYPKDRRNRLFRNNCNNVPYYAASCPRINASLPLQNFSQKADCFQASHSLQQGSSVGSPGTR